MTSAAWNRSKATKRCNVFPTVWAAIYGCKGEQTHAWRYTVGHFGRRVAEYACPTCQAADALTKGVDRAEYQRLLREAQDAAGVEDYRTADVRIIDGVPTIVGTMPAPREEAELPAQTVLITGNTFPVKEALKALGGRWDASEKGWRVPVDRAGEARRLVA